MESRVSWIDAAKGLSIILVVYSHSITSVDDVSMPHPAIGAINYWLRDIRMPLFMLVSGILAANILTKGWAELWSRRLANSLWIYCIWTVIIAGAYSFTKEANSLFDQFYAPDTQLWYIAALCLYLPATKLLLKAGASVAVGIALMIHLLAALLPGEPFVYETSARLFVFFVVGAAFAPILLAWVARDRSSIAAISLAGLVVSLYLRAEMGVTVFGVAAVLALAAIASVRLTALSRVLGYVGRNTLPIFCLHSIFLVFMSMIGHWSLPGSSIWGVAAFTAISTLLSLLAYRFLQPVTLLWKAPKLRLASARSGSTPA